MLNVEHLVSVFLLRHWVAAFFNAGLTALFGIGLIWGAERLKLPRFSFSKRLHLRRLVVLVALLKGAFYLVRGDAASLQKGKHFGLGIQIPDPGQLVGPVPMTVMNIWHPTAATSLVTWVLVSFAGAFLLWRLRQMAISRRVLQSYLSLKDHPQNPRIEGLLHKAAATMKINSRRSLPQIVMAEIDYPTPLLLGLSQPLILISPRLTSELNDLELEMALRHELAHYLRRDNWRRWLQSCVEDIGRINGISQFLGKRAVFLEEEICDWMAVKTADEALALGRAITKAAQIIPAYPEPTKALSSPSGQMPIDSLDPVVPALLGRHTRMWKEPSALTQRLQALVKCATELSSSITKVPDRPKLSFQRLSNLILQGVGAILFWLLMVGILYGKLHVVFRLN